MYTCLAKIYSYHTLLHRSYFDLFQGLHSTQISALLGTAGILHRVMKSLSNKSQLRSASITPSYITGENPT